MGLTLVNADELIGWGIGVDFEGRKARYAILHAAQAADDLTHGIPVVPGLYAAIRSQSLPDRRGGADSIIG